MHTQVHGLPWAVTSNAAGRAMGPAVPWDGPWPCVASHALDLSPRPERGRRKGLVSTVCACVQLSVTETRIHKGEGVNHVLGFTCLSV